MTEPLNIHGAARRAGELYDRGFCRGAIDILEVELQRRPEAGALWRLRAVMLQRQGRRAEAFDNIQRALVLAPLGPEGMLVLADGYARSGQRTSAADIYEELAASNEFPSELWEPLYSGLCTTGRWQSALALCRRMVQARPEDDWLYFATAYALARLGRPPELSANMLRKAIHLNHTEPRYRASLVVQLLRMGQPEEAYRSFADFSSDALASLSCRCCLHKILKLCIERGDRSRAASVAAQLAALAGRQESASDTQEEAP